VTSMFIRCSAWFGSVRIGFLAPEIFIRLGSAPFSRLFEQRRLSPVDKLRRGLAHKCPMLKLSCGEKVGDFFFPQGTPIWIALECWLLFFWPRLNGQLALAKRFTVRAAARTRICKLNCVVFPTARRTDFIRSVCAVTNCAKTATWTR
jgi:hypothetical protein